MPIVQPEAGATRGLGSTFAQLASTVQAACLPKHHPATHRSCRRVKVRSGARPCVVTAVRPERLRRVSWDRPARWAMPASLTGASAWACGQRRSATVGRGTTRHVAGHPMQLVGTREMRGARAAARSRSGAAPRQAECSQHMRSPGGRRGPGLAAAVPPVPPAPHLSPGQHPARAAAWAGRGQGWGAHASMSARRLACSPHAEPELAQRACQRALRQRRSIQSGKHRMPG